MSTIHQSSPMAIQPLHNPAQAAYVSHPPGSLNASNNSTVVTTPNVPAGANALLARNEFKARNPFVSPTDNIMTPCTAKLNQVKKKHFTKAKPIQLFAIPGIDGSGNTSSSGLFCSTDQDVMASDVEKSDKEKENSGAQMELEKF